MNCAAAAELKLRATPKGTFVEGAKRCAAQSYSEIDALMSRGTLNRTVASTSMNATSSRAHTVVTITVAQLRARGDAYVRAEFPKLSYISCAAAAQFSAQFSAQFLGAIL